MGSRALGTEGLRAVSHRRAMWPRPWTSVGGAEVQGPGEALGVTPHLGLLVPWPEVPWSHYAVFSDVLMGGGRPLSPHKHHSAPSHLCCHHGCGVTRLQQGDRGCWSLEIRIRGSRFSMASKQSKSSRSEAAEAGSERSSGRRRARKARSGGRSYPWARRAVVKMGARQLPSWPRGAPPGGPPKPPQGSMMVTLREAD